MNTYMVTVTDIHSDDSPITYRVRSTKPLGPFVATYFTDQQADEGWRLLSVNDWYVQHGQITTRKYHNYTKGEPL